MSQNENVGAAKAPHRASARRGALRAAAPAAALLVVVFAVPILWLHRSSNHNLLSFHGTLHTAIAQRVVDGQIPPENPFLAGQTLRYYWVYHWLGSVVSQVTGIHYLWAFEVMSIAGLVVLAVAAVALASRLYASPATGVLIGVIAMAGSNGLGWLIAAGRVALHGSGILNGSATAVTSPILEVAHYGDVRFGPNFIYFIHCTSRPLAFGLALGMAASLHSVMGGNRRFALLLLFLTSSLGIAVNPLIGLAAAGALIVGIGWMTMSRVVLRRRGNGMAVRSALAAVVVLVLSAAAVAPTYAQLLGTAAGDAGVAISPFRWRTLAMVATNLSLTAVVALIGFPRWPAIDRNYLWVVTCAGSVLIAAAVVLRLPVGNEHNLFNTGVLLLAVPAGAAAVPASVVSLRRQWLRVLALSSPFVPTALVVLSAYLGRAPAPVRLAGTRLILLPEDSPTSRLYDWVRRSTPEDAVFVVDPYAAALQLCNVDDFPAFAERVLFAGQGSYLTSRHPEYAYRRALSAKLAYGVVVPPEDRAYLEGLGRPFYIVTFHGGEPNLMRRLQDRHGDPVFAVSPVAVFRIRQP